MNTVWYHALLPEELINQLKALAKNDRRSLSNYIRVVLEKHVKKADAEKVNRRRMT